MSANESITGEIIGVRDVGSGYIVFVDGGEGRILPITLDRQAVWELRANGQVEWTDLIGRQLSFDGSKATFTANGTSHAAGDRP